MEWYVLVYDFNKRKVVDFNIFNNFTFRKRVFELLEEDLKGEKFKEALRRTLKYCFWSKREYELSIGDAFEEDLDNYEKIDVFRQLEKNIDILATYILYQSKQEEILEILETLQKI